MKHQTIVLLTLAVTLFTSCTRLDIVEPFTDDTVTGPFVQINGKMTNETPYPNWVILGDNDTTYRPMNLPERFKKKGLAVTAEVKIRNDIDDIMTGTIIEIRSIQQREGVM